MADISYGGGRAGWEDAARRAQEAAAAAENLQARAKDVERQEREIAGTEEGGSRVRTGLAEATQNLSDALLRNIEVIGQENAALRENVALLERAAAARRQIATTVISGSALTRGAATAEASTVAPAALAVAEDPLARTRYQRALEQQSQAEAARVRANAAYAASLRPASGASAAEQAELLAVREQTREQVTVAKRQTAAAQADVAAQEQLATARKAQQAELQQTNVALAAQARAEQQAAAAAEQVAAQRSAQALEMAGQQVGRQPPLMLPPGPAGGYGREPIIAGPIPTHGFGPAMGDWRERPGAPQFYAGAGTPYGPTSGPPYGYDAVAPGSLSAGAGSGARYRPPTVMGGPAEPTITGEPAELALRDQATRNYSAISNLGSAQRATNLAFNESVASYAASSNALSRHGALTTEFIQAFARGQVTLREFESQMVSTMGKFGGWIAAGAAVYGVYESIKHLAGGATETQTGIEQVGRFIPTIGQPGQQEELAGQFRDISQQFNVPIKEVVESMSVVARVFHNVTDAANATRAVLAAVKLDMVPREQAVQFVTGIAQTMGWSQLPAGQGGALTLGLIDSLNEVQRQFAAKVAQTLPAVARAAPAALASGTDLRTIEALASVGVTAGLPGMQVGTALLRSMGTFAFRPQSEAAFRGFGISADPANYGKLLNDVIAVIDRRGAGQISQPQVRQLAQALGGPLLGTRVLLPILEREYRTPGTISRYEQAVREPGSFQSDLNRVLNTTAERFHSLGIQLEQFGSLLESSGVLQPLLAGFDAVSTVLHGIEAFATPIAHALAAFNQLPGAVRESLGAFVAFRAARALYGTQFGSNAQGFVGNLPGLGALDTQPRAAIRGTLARLETYQLPYQQGAENAAVRRVMELQARQVQNQANVAAFRDDPGSRAAAVMPVGTPPRQAYENEVTRLQGLIADDEQRIDRAEQARVDQIERTARLEADITVLKDRHYSTAQKLVYMEDRGLVAVQQGVSATEEATAAARARIELLAAGNAALARQAEGGMAAGAPGMMGAGAAALGLGAVGAAAARAREVDTQAIANVVSDPVIVSAAMRGVQMSGDLATMSNYAALRAGGMTREEAAFTSRYAETPGARYGGPVLVGQRPGESPGESAASFARRAGTFLMGPGLPFAGMMLSQGIGGLVGGGAGSYISGVGGDAFTGMMIAQMMGGGGRGMGLGLGLGMLAGGLQQGRTGLGLGTSIAGGATAGAAMGAILGFGVPGAILGGVLGGAGGGVLDLLGFGAPSGPKQVATGLTGNDAISKVARGGRVNAQDVQTFGDNFAQTMDAAFTATGDSATNAQNSITKQLTQLTSLVSAFGATSVMGKSAISLLSSAIAQAAEGTATDPSSAGQIIAKFDGLVQQAQQDADAAIKWGAAAARAANVPDAVRTALGQETITQGPTPRFAASPLGFGTSPLGEQITPAISAPGFTERFAWARTAHYSRLSSSPSQTSYYNMTIAQMDSTIRAGMAQTYQGRADLQAAISMQDKTLAELESGGGQAKTWTTTVGRGRGSHQVVHTEDVTQQIEALKQARAQNLLKLEGVNAAIAEAQDKTAQANDAAWQQITQMLEQASTQQAEIANTSDRAHPVAQSRRLLGAATANIGTVRQTIRQAGNQMSPTTARSLLQSALQGQYDAQTQYAQTVTQQAQQAGTLRENAIPTYNPLERARVELQTAAAVYRALAAMPAMKGSPELGQALANLEAAQQTVADAAYQQSATLIGAEEQLAVAQAHGDAALQASAHAAAGARMLAIARTPAERDTARATIIDSQTQAADAARQTADLRGQIAEAQSYGNDVGAAQAAVTLARADISSASNTQQRLQAELALVQAENQLKQAYQSRIMAMGELAASQTNDPVKQARDMMQAAAKALAATPAGEVDLHAKAQTEYNNRKQALTDSLVTQREESVKFQLDMQQINTQQAITMLQDLLRMKGITLQARQSIAEQIRQLQQGDNTGGKFDLAPGSIHLPTYADVTRAIYGATGNRASENRTPFGAVAHATRTSIDAVNRAHVDVYRAASALANPTMAREIRIDNRPVIQVYVGDKRDLLAVADAIDRGVHSSLKSRLRAAGIRGT